MSMTNFTMEQSLDETLEQLKKHQTQQRRQVISPTAHKHDENLEKLKVLNFSNQSQELSPGNFNDYLSAETNAPVGARVMLSFSQDMHMNTSNTSQLPLTPAEHQFQQFNEVFPDSPNSGFDSTFNHGAQTPPQINVMGRLHRNADWSKRRPSFLAESGMSNSQQKQFISIENNVQNNDQMVLLESLMEENITGTSPKKRSLSTPNALEMETEIPDQHNLSPSELAKIKNRQAAKRSRLKKKNHIQELEGRVTQLSLRVAQLEDENSILRLQTQSKTTWDLL